MSTNFYITLFILLFSVLNSYGQCSPDITPPLITCPANVTETCPWNVDFISPTATDNCGFVVLQTWTLTGATIGSSPITGINDASLEFFEAGTTTVTYYIEDDSGNSATCNFTVTITDTQAPLLICPEDLTVPNDLGSCSAIINDFGFMSAWDNCSGIAVNLEPGGLPIGSSFPVGTTTNTFTFTDAVGNSSSCTFDITVTDEEDPVISCPTDIIANTTAGLCEANVTIPSVTATDNCSIASITNDFNSGGADASGTYPLGTTIVNYTVTDSAGNIATCSTQVTVVNSQSPIIALIGSSTLTLEACATYSENGATANDNCLGDISGSIVINSSALDLNTIGTYSVYYTIYDSIGNITTQEVRTVNVVDTTSPSLTLVGPNPLNIGDCSTYVELGAEAIDPCFGDISANVVVDNSTVNSSVLGSYTVTYNVMDDSNNTTSQITRVVNVIEITAPVITLIGENPQTIEACSDYTELGATATDPCFNTDYSGDIVIDTSALDTGVVGLYVVNYNVSDIYGNAAIELTRTIEVVDTTPPVINCPSNISAGNDVGLCTALVTYSSPVVTDCSSTTITQIAGLPTGSVFPLGTTTNTFEVIDAEGFIDSCSFDVIVTDSEAPEISCPEDITVTNDTGLCNAVVAFTVPTGTDNCTGFTTTQTAGLVSGSAFPIGTTTNTFLVEDAAGNTSSCSFDITVSDTEFPVISCPSDIIVDNDSGLCTAVVSYSQPVGTDNCTGQTTVQIAGLSSGSVFPIGTTTNTFEVTDATGNIQSCSFDVIVNDTENPEISCTSDIIVDNDSGLCTAVVSYSQPVGTDNCTGQTTVQIAGLSSGSVFSMGTTTNTFEVTDAAGNIQSCSFDVTVNDTENPVAICQDISLQLDPVTGLVSITEAQIDNGSSDNCSINYSLSETAFDCTNIGANTVILTVTDDTGNSSSCSAVVTITDLSENASVDIVGSENTICQNGSVTFTATPTNGGTTPSYQWQINGLDVSGETDSTFTTSTLNNSDLITVLMTSSTSICAQPVLSNAISITVNDDNASADAGLDVTNSICTETTITLAGNAITGSGSTGLWSVTSGQTSGFSFSDVNNPTSTFTGDIGESYALTWSIDNPEPCADTSDSMTINFVGCNALDFDGVDDNITFRDNYNFSSDFTIEVWIKSDVTNSNIQTIFSKRESNNLSNGYDLRLVNNIISFNWNNGESLTSPFQITPNRWCHLALSYEGGTYRLYIDGLEVNNAPGVAPTTNIADCIVGAMDDTLSPFLPVHYFNGGMDELRIWNVALTTTQIRKMMNQEIEIDATDVMGSVVPITIDGLTWNNLNGYYQMNQSSDLSGGNLVSNNSSTINGLLRYMTTLQPETAPIPYQSNSNGTWSDSSTWLFGSSQAIPNSLGVDGTTSIDWNIVKTLHNISSGDTNITLLGLMVISNTLSIENTDALDGQSLRVSDYLYLDGTLDLVGESQLLQDMGSIIDSNGTGVLERDQQGTTNQYNYNYWCSPVSTNGINYSVNDVLRNGMDPEAPDAIQWLSGYDTTGSVNPVSLSNRWIYTYENYPSDSYADWSYKGETGLIDIGLGFTLKGSGTLAPPLAGEQNYVFTGIPNNGDISIPITADYQALVGNPYPSAIDANAFIQDNNSSILGALYFWEHFETNATHILEDYEGGYSIYNLVGGAPAVAPNGISQNGTPVKIPERFVPVAQGFFVGANATGGEVVFNNNQRIFVKESVTGNANNGSVFFKQSGSNSTTNEVVKRVRINFKSPEGAIRHLLLGFVPNNLATYGFDYGYDAINTDDFPNDMSWIIEDEQYVIQGVGEFDETKKHPLGIFLNSSGKIEISLEGLENFESEIDVYVYDALLNTYSKIYENNNFDMFLESDDYLNRFYLAFKDESTLSNSTQELQQPTVQYLNNTNEIYINAPNFIEVNNVYLINVVGQSVKYWSQKTIGLSNTIKIPVTNISEGVYIIKVETNIGIISKKIIVKY